MSSTVNWTSKRCCFEEYHIPNNTSSPLQFLQRHPDTSVVVWCDLMKCGRMAISEIDEFSNLLSHILHARYKSSAAIVIAPYLVSEKHQGYRGQIRTAVGESLQTQWWFRSYSFCNLRYSEPKNTIGSFPHELWHFGQGFGGQDGHEKPIQSIDLAAVRPAQSEEACATPVWCLGCLATWYYNHDMICSTGCSTQIECFVVICWHLD